MDAAADEQRQRQWRGDARTSPSPSLQAGQKKIPFQPMLLRGGSGGARDLNDASALREHNRRLEARVLELEGTVDACLNLVSGLGA